MSLVCLALICCPEIRHEGDGFGQADGNVSEDARDSMGALALPVPAQASSGPAAWPDVRLYVLLGDHEGLIGGEAAPLEIENVNEIARRKRRGICPLPHEEVGVGKSFLRARILE